MYNDVRISSLLSNCLTGSRFPFLLFVKLSDRRECVFFFVEGERLTNEEISCIDADISTMICCSS